MGSIPDEVTGFFSCPNLSSRTMALGLTQPLTEMSTRNLPGGKGSRCISLITSPPSVSWLNRKCGSLDISQPYESPWPVNGDSFTFLTQKLIFCHLWWPLEGIMHLWTLFWRSWHVMTQFCISSPVRREDIDFVGTSFMFRFYVSALAWFRWHSYLIKIKSQIMKFFWTGSLIHTFIHCVVNRQCSALLTNNAISLLKLENQGSISVLLIILSPESSFNTS
jgi:hypothetical protein